MEELKPKGKYLTQSADVPQEERLFVTAVITDDVETWREATSDETSEHLKTILNEEPI